MADFHYTYSAPEQAEIRRIREKYLPREESTLEKQRRLDAQAERPGMVASLSLGLVGTPVLGLGMSCCLVWSLFAPGVVLGILGIAMVAAAYPAHRWITKRQRQKIAPQILALTEELGG